MQIPKHVARQCLIVGVNMIFKVINAFAMSAVAIASQSALAGAHNCEQSTDQAAVASCDSQKLVDLEKHLNSVYQQALSRMPDADQFDIRKNKNQLIKAEEAWQTYTKENCLYVGGLEGGNNQWVSYFALKCRIAETQLRINFLKKSHKLVN